MERHKMGDKDRDVNVTDLKGIFENKVISIQVKTPLV
jgi:hypothetical protein